MGELRVLQAIRLKGRISATALAATLGDPPAAVVATVDELTGAGLLVGGDAVSLSEAGRARCHELLACERAAADAAALASAYNAFCGVNTDLKATVTEWQLSRDGGVLHGLDGIHRRIVPIITAVAEQLPRLSGYATKLETALKRVLAGDTGWLARPDLDSYHTVWFELHEELLQACGLSRRTDD